MTLGIYCVNQNKIYHRDHRERKSFYLKTLF
ncbi:MAG: hypothetical protein ACI96W_002038, partial [Paraglaciecola sp.]